MRGADGQLTDYTGNGLTGNAYYQYGQQRVPIDPVSVANSAIQLTLPRPLSTQLPVVLNLQDRNQNYLPVSQRYTIRPGTANGTRLE